MPHEGVIEKEGNTLVRSINKLATVLVPCQPAGKITPGIILGAVTVKGSGHAQGWGYRLLEH